MPSWAIHVWSVTYWRPLAPVSKSAIRAIEKASARSDPASVTQRAARPANSPSSPAAAGSQRRIERCRVIGSRRLQEEVEAHADQAEHQQRRIGAQEAV